MAAYGLFSKALTDGQVRMYLSDDWALVKLHLTKLPKEWVDTDAWDRAYAWDAIREGAILVTDNFMWQYVEVNGDTFDTDGHGEVLFAEGSVLFLKEMLAGDEQ